MNWHPITEPAPEGVRLLFYAPERDYIFIGVVRDGRWTDESEHIPGYGSPEVVGVTHWMPLPPKPFRENG